ncbi:hypothetical protein OQA88_663 [Cercophora sp. LCS_1]
MDRQSLNTSTENAKTNQQSPTDNNKQTGHNAITENVPLRQPLPPTSTRHQAISHLHRHPSMIALNYATRSYKRLLQGSSGSVAAYETTSKGSSIMEQIEEDNAFPERMEFIDREDGVEIAWALPVGFVRWMIMRRR